MDQFKIGKFIAECRKEKKITQMQLAEKLNITDKAISKWECGKAMPDSSIMLELCDILGIGVNELLCGEKINMEEKNRKNEDLLLELARKEENLRRKLYVNSIIFLITSFLMYILASTITYFAHKGIVKAEDSLLTAMVVIYIFATVMVSRMQADSLYCVCEKCGYKFAPRYRDAFLTVPWRKNKKTVYRVKCPCCNKKIWATSIVPKRKKKTDI